MSDETDDEKRDAPGDDGIDRRGFLRCMAWAGTGVLWTVGSGVLRSAGIEAVAYERHATKSRGGDFSFVQISDSHMGFNKPANPDVAATLQEAIRRINALPEPPVLLLHTGDVSHLSKPSEFDAVDQMLHEAKVGRVFTVPGEHDVLTDDGKDYLERYGKGTRGAGWRSFDVKGIHFVGLVNVVDLKAGGLGHLGAEQLSWLADDLKGHPSSTPIVVFAHIPLWSVYPEWGWGTDDGARALSYLKRFGSVTVLNGHIHQVMQKVEGNVTFHTAMSTAFPQPKPGQAPSPGPMKVASDRLQSVLGITSVHYAPGRRPLAVVDSPLAAHSGSIAERITIDNFMFSPDVVHVGAGIEVTWINHDDIPHTVVSTDRRFKSPPLDTGETFSFRFGKPGTYEYFCSLHPKMTGKLVVT